MRAAAHRAMLDDVRAVAVVVALGAVLSACALPPERTFTFGSASPGASTSASVSATPTPEQTKPFTVTQQPIAPPTYARWALDGTRFVLFYDSPAAGFRLVDANGSVVLRIPVAGSGIFGPETCVVSARREREIVTWTGLDDAAYRQLLATWSTYRLEADAVAGPTVTVPLSDTGCRRP